MKSLRLSLFIFISVFFVHTLAVVHDAVHPFHADLHSTPSELPAQDSHAHATHHHAESSTTSAPSHSVEAWLCELWDKVTHSAFNTSAKLSLPSVEYDPPGLVVVIDALLSVAIYPSFWGRAPPAYFV